jgi:hypothetical protein
VGIDRSEALANDPGMAERLIVEREIGGNDRWFASEKQSARSALPYRA